MNPTAAPEVTCMEEISIPNVKVGKVIGRGGSMIRHLQVQSGCKIVLAISSNGEQTRKVALQGNPRQILEAKKLINDLLVDDLEFLVPENRLGLLIGKKGETIKKIKSQTGTDIFISQNTDGRYPGQKQVIISGGNLAVEEASRKVLEILNSEFVCGICMEVVLDKEGDKAKFGILPSCTHCYCLSCITEWRRSKYDNELTKACPECRVIQDFVVPSKVWVENATSKAEFLDRFKKNAARKDCKIFKENFGHCPAGPKCVYRHRNDVSGEELVEVKIPDHLVGLLIGKAGVTIKSLQAETNTRMQMMKEGDNVVGQSVLKITGEPAYLGGAVEKVNEMILEFMLKQTFL